LNIASVGWITENGKFLLHLLWSWWNARNKANAGQQMAPHDGLFVSMGFNPNRNDKYYKKSI
jgi:hypothetical protein